MVYDDFYLILVLIVGKFFIIGYINEVIGICLNFFCIIFDDFIIDLKLVVFFFKVKLLVMKILKMYSDIEIDYVVMFMSVIY